MTFPPSKSTVILRITTITCYLISAPDDVSLVVSSDSDHRLGGFIFYDEVVYPTNDRMHNVPLQILEYE